MTLRMQYADDGQANFCNWAEEDIGAVGEYAKRIVWTRLGSGAGPSPTVLGSLSASSVASVSFSEIVL